MSFAHPVFTAAVAGGRALASRAAQIIYREVGEAAVNMAAEAVVGIAVDSAQAAANFTVDQVRQLQSATIANMLGVHCPGVNEDEVIRDDATVTILLNEIATRPDGADAVGDVFEARAAASQFDARTSAAVSNISTPGGCALGILRSQNDLVSRARFPDGSGAPARVRQCVRTSRDSFYVSAEIHEWRYVRDNQWGAVLAEVEQYAERLSIAITTADPNFPLPAFDEILNPESLAFLLEEDNISFATIDYSFGNFADSKEMRQGVEHLRRVNRSVTGEGFTDLFRLLGRDRDAVVAEINNNTDWSPQLRSLMRLDVKRNSGEAGSVDVADAG